MQYLLTVLQVPAEALWRSKGLHHSPLLLMLPSSVIMDPWLSACLWIALDVVSGVALAALAATLAKRAERHVRIVPSFVAACFLLNPYAVAACVAKSMSQWRSCLTLLALLSAVHGVWLLVACVQALNTVLFMNPVCVTPALLLLGADAHAKYGRWRVQFGQRQSDAWTQWLRRTTVRYAAWLGALLLLSALYSRDPTLSFVRSVYGSRILVDDLAPNAGLVWYFFVEMFPHFRGFFTMVVNLHMLSYTVPALLKWRSDPLFAITVLVGIHALFQTYPSAGDSALYLALWSVSYTRLSDWSANANFFYAINLVQGLGLGSLLLDSVWAWGRERWELERKQEQDTSPPGVRFVVQR
ncbi:hypothetical protein MEQU1_000705 [Malassezia equina]|uniref:GPI transamidase subunit PIG-U n=1 Tax=Malassezia equina TaxID=1381935 RepID=A0AAF0IZ28_9BASI|nr:hypothetical protein MEQU1_000705 [Malassezia equina]